MIASFGKSDEHELLLLVLVATSILSFSWLSSSSFFEKSFFFLRKMQPRAMNLLLLRPSLCERVFLCYRISAKVSFLFLTNCLKEGCLASLLRIEKLSLFPLWLRFSMHLILILLAGVLWWNGSSNLIGRQRSGRTLNASSPSAWPVLNQQFWCIFFSSRMPVYGNRKDDKNFVCWYLLK